MAVYLDFEGTKKINVLEVLIWGFGGCRIFLTRVRYLCLALDMVTGLSYNHVPNFGSHLDFEVAKNIHVPFVLIQDFGGCWMILTGVWHFNLDLDMVTSL